MPKLKKDIKRDFKNSLPGIGLSEAQIDLLNSAERFCREKSPIEQVRQNLLTEQGFNLQHWSEVVAMGWSAISIPEAYDGLGLKIGDVVPIIEMMGRHLMHTPFLTTTLAAQALVKGGADTQRADVLPQLAKGKIAALALFEPRSDYDLNNINVQAEIFENGYKLTGTKTLVQDFMVADYLILSAKLEGETRLFLLEAGRVPETAIRREVLIDETKRSYAVKLDGLALPAEAIMPLETTQAALKHIHLCATLFYAAEMVGGTKACLDYTVEYLKTRKQFGRLIGSYQALKHPIVDGFVAYEKARSLLYSAAGYFDETAVRMAKIKADQAFSFISDRAIQFHGGFGFTYDCDAQLYRRRAIFDAAQFGGAHYHKRQLARTLFGKRCLS